MDIKSKVSTSLALCFIGLLFTFAFTWIIFDFQNSPNSLKDTWTIISGVFSGFATLIAAYIASLLFNDWRDQENEIFKRNLAHKIYNDMGELLSMFISKNEKYDIEDLQFKFQKINTNLLLYSKKEKSIKKLIIHFGVIYTRQIGIYEKHNTSLKIRDSMDFLNEYSVVLHTVAELVGIDKSSADIQFYLKVMKNTLKTADSEWLKEKADEILNEVKTTK